MCERYIDQLPLAHPQPGAWPTTQACALTGNQTSNPSVSRQALNPLSHTSQGSLATFKMLSLSLTFGILMMMCLGVCLSGFILLGTLCTSWTCMSVAFTKLEKFSVIIFSSRFFFQIVFHFLALSLLLPAPP